MSALPKSPRWNLNLSEELCFWCNTPTGNMILNGLLPNDEKAPEKQYRDYTPCKKCEGIMVTGITIIQCTSVANNFKQLQDGLYPTGLWTTVPESWIKSMFKPEAADKIIEGKAVNITVELWSRLGLPNLINSGVTETMMGYTQTNFV